MEQLFVFETHIEGVPQRISFRLPINSEFVITNQYRPNIFPIPAMVVNCQAGEAISDFYTDCNNIINIASKSSNSGVDAIVDGLINVVQSHVRKCGRLIFDDLMIYVDCFAHIIKAMGLSEKDVKECYLIELAIIVESLIPYIKDSATLAPFSQTTLYSSLIQHANELSIRLTGKPFIQ